MSLRIQTNIEAFDAHRNLVTTENNLSKSMEKLSSGYRINRAADDAAGLAISQKLESQIGGLQQAQRNAQDAESLVQTAEGAMAEVQSMLQRIRDLAVQFNNGTLSSSDAAAITQEVAQLCAEIDRIGSQTQFSGIPLLTGNTALTFQIGADDGQTLSVSGIQLFGSSGTVNPNMLTWTYGTPVSLSSIDAAIDGVSADRAQFGAIQNRIDHTLNNLATYEENLSASESRIKDVDMASEMVNFTKLQILQQAGTAMLAQANQTPSTVLQLLR
jgi:flagellin